MRNHHTLKLRDGLRFIGRAAALCLLFLLVRGAEAAPFSPKVIILEFHGMKQGIITEDLTRLPHFRKMIRGTFKDGGYVYFPRVLTTIPAASQPAVTSLYTGLYPKHTGVVSSIWFDRRTAEVCTLISYSQQRINRILTTNSVRTLFDLVSQNGKKSLTTMLMLTNGADWSIRSWVPFWGNASVLGLFRNGRLIPDGRYVDEKTMSAFLTGHISSFQDSLAGIYKASGTIPDVSAVQLLGTDLFSHYPFKEPRRWHISMNSIQKYYAQEVLDPLMGELVNTLNRMKCFQDTIFVMVSDHGFSPITKLVRNEIFDRNLKRQFHLPSWWRSNRRADAIIMPGASTKEVYLKNRQSQNWTDPPRLLGDVKPAVDLLLSDPEILACTNTLLIRQYSGERHEGPTEADQWWVFDWLSYRASAGGDDRAFLSALRPLSTLASRFELGHYVVDGVRSQYTRETAPDIKLINKKGFYFENDTDKYGHHGSYYPDDCIVSIWLCGPGLTRVLPGRHVVRQTISTLDVVPMVLQLLDIPIPAGLDGFNPLVGIEENVDSTALSGVFSPSQP